MIPIVYFPNASYNNKSLKRVTRSTFVGKRYRYFTYEAVLLKSMPAKRYLDSDNIFARLMLPKKLGAIPSEIEKSICTLADVDRIDSILNHAMDIHDWKEIKQLMN